MAEDDWPTHRARRAQPAAPPTTSTNPSPHESSPHKSTPPGTDRKPVNGDTASERSWVEQAAIDDGDLTADEQRELRQLRGSAQALRDSRELLREAAAFFADDQPSKPRQQRRDD